jgi:hypothetical protein
VRKTGVFAPPLGNEGAAGPRHVIEAQRPQFANRPMRCARRITHDQSRHLGEWVATFEGAHESRHGALAVIDDNGRHIRGQKRRGVRGGGMSANDNGHV